MFEKVYIKRITTAPASITTVDSALLSGNNINNNKIKEIRKINKERHDRIVGAGQKRIFTLADISLLRLEERWSAMESAERAFASEIWKEQAVLCVSLGRLIVKHSNVFRMSKGLSEVKWCFALAKIGYGHSKDMGLKKVSFSHVGFSQRMAAFPFSSQSAAENLAMHSCLDNEDM